MRALEFAWGAISLYCSVMAKMPKIRNAVRMISSLKACMGVMAKPGWVKKTPAAPPAARVSCAVWLKWSMTGTYKV